MAKDLIPHLKSLAGVARCLWSYGWAEANAGNMSFRLARRILTHAGRRNMTPLPQGFPSLAGEQILISGTGKRMRDLASFPSRCMLLIEISKDGNGYFRLDGNANPTSEFLTHLCVHQSAMDYDRNRRVVLHTHPENIIAMNHLQGMDEPSTFMEALYAVHPELGLHLGKAAIEIVPYFRPGTMELAQATATALRTAMIVVWPFHGTVSLADDPDKALDYAELLDKAASVYLKVKAAGGGICKNFF